MPPGTFRGKRVWEWGARRCKKTSQRHLFMSYVHFFYRTCDTLLLNPFNLARLSLLWARWNLHPPWWPLGVVPRTLQFPSIWLCFRSLDFPSQNFNPVSHPIRDYSLSASFVFLFFSLLALFLVWKLFRQALLILINKCTISKRFLSWLRCRHRAQWHV